MNIVKSFVRTLTVAGALVLAAPAQALVLQGATYITPSTTLPACGAFCSNVGTDIRQISDGDTSNLNGWAGGNGLVGTIKLDLIGNFDLTSFSLWNDINIAREGVGDFQLHFFDATDQIISTSARYTALIGTPNPGVYNFATVEDVSRVDLEVLTLLTGGVCCRIEIREVAFNGDPSVTTPPGTVPEPTGLALLGIGLLGAAAARRRRFGQN